VKRIVPARFRPYDYFIETPTRLLWAMEGMTSYYGDLTLVRSRRWTVQRYLDHLAREIDTLERAPARQFLSLSESSFNSWLSDPAEMHDYPNAWYSFYNKGEIVSALLDLAIRRETNGERSLDDVLAILWEEYGKTGRGLEEDAMPRIVARVANIGEFFERYVDGVEPLPYGQLFAAAGVAFSAKARKPEQSFLGARLKVQDGLIVDAVLRDAAAMEAGLLPGDELIAVEGNRVTTEAAADAAMRALPVGRSAELLIVRAGVLRTLTLKGQPDPRPEVSLRVQGLSGIRRGWLWSDE